MVIFSSSSSTSRPNFLLPIILIVISTCRCVAISSRDRPSDDHYLGHTCSKSRLNRNTARDYWNTLSLLKNDLVNNVSPGASVMRWWPLPGSNKYIYGLAMCRGDATQRDCTDCVNDAATQSTKTYCPISRSATVWRDYCEFKYSDVDFYGDIDVVNKLIITNNKRDFDSGAQQAADVLLRRLKENLSLKAVNKSYDSGMTPGAQVIYGMAQCTEDLSKDACRSCLSFALRELSQCCGLFSGARVNLGSCNVRRETYRFLRSVN